MIQNAIEGFNRWARDLSARLRTERDGATMVEYGLIVAAIAMVVVLAALALGDGIDTLFGDAETCVENATTANCD